MLLSDNEALFVEIITKIYEITGIQQTYIEKDFFAR